jgi:hypothetical protein
MTAVMTTFRFMDAVNTNTSKSRGGSHASVEQHQCRARCMIEVGIAARERKDREMSRLQRHHTGAPAEQPMRTEHHAYQFEMRAPA